MDIISSPPNQKRHRRMMQNLLLAVIVGLLTTYVWPSSSMAQWQSDTLYRVLEEIEVTATKNVRALSEVPGRVGVISTDELMLTPAATMADAMRNVSGVNTSSSSGSSPCVPA
jgi:outer membrane receptor for ferrienterochelin and colicin